MTSMIDSTPSLASGDPASTGSAGPGRRAALAARLPSLTGLRFPAALLVFAYHSSFMGVFRDSGFSGRFGEVVAQAGGLGVSFFFVLSGFVLTWSARTEDTARAFWRRRFVKIYPNYVIAWALALVVFAGSYTSVRQAVANLFMLQVWVPDFGFNFGVNPPSWSLATELFFYAAFPLLLAGARRIADRHLKLWIAGAMATVLATPAISYLLLPGGAGIPGQPSVSVDQYWFGYLLPPVRLVDFALGILVARAVRAGRWRNIGMVWSALLLAVGYTASSWLPYLWGQRATCVIPVALLIAATAQADAEGRFTPFRNRTMTWLGEVSFAFYLLHFTVLKWGRSLLGTSTFGTPAAFAVLLAGAVLAVAAASLLHRLVERPTTRRFSSPKRRPAL